MTPARSSRSSIAASGSADRTGIRDKMMDVANAPGEKIYAGELAKGLELAAAGTDIDYEGATGVELIGPGEARGSYRVYEINDNAASTTRLPLIRTSGGRHPRGRPPPARERRMIRVEDLHMHFGGIRAVDGASIDIAGGSITGLIGPNGAGKSTLFNVIAGLFQPTSGQVWLDGAEITGLPPHELFHKGLLRTFQIAHEFSTLTVRENLMMVPAGQPGEVLWDSLVQARRASAPARPRCAPRPTTSSASSRSATSPTSSPATSPAARRSCSSSAAP